jgi:hypothetical protein
MMKSFLIGAGLCLALASTAAGESPQFAQFRRFCLDTHADHHAALEAAKAEGFAAAPPEMVAGMRSSLNGTDMDLFIRGSGATTQMLIVGTKSFPILGGNYPAVACLYAVPSADPGTDADTYGWGGVKPMPSTDGTPPIMVFSGPLGHHVSAAGISDSETERRLHQGGVEFLMSGDIGGGHYMFAYGLFQAPH